jgi:hypothetical protein
MACENTITVFYRIPRTVVSILLARASSIELDKQVGQSKLGYDLLPRNRLSPPRNRVSPRLAFRPHRRPPVHEQHVILSFVSLLIKSMRSFLPQNWSLHGRLAKPWQPDRCCQAPANRGSLAPHEFSGVQNTTRVNKLAVGRQCDIEQS